MLSFILVACLRKDFCFLDVLDNCLVAKIEYLQDHLLDCYNFIRLACIQAVFNLKEKEAGWKQSEVLSLMRINNQLLGEGPE